MPVRTGAGHGQSGRFGRDDQSAQARGGRDGSHSPVACCLYESTVKRTGVVTGVTYACQGLALPSGEVLHVKVGLYSGPSLVASETVRSGAKYRFSVPPGSYRVTGWWGSKGVAVRAGHRVTADFFDTRD